MLMSPPYGRTPTLESHKLYRNGDLSTALENYLEAYSRDPNNLETLTGLLQTRFELGHYEECINSIHEALDLEKDPAVLKTLWLKEAQCHLFLDQLQDVVRVCETLGGIQAQKLLEAVKSYEKHAISEPQAIVEDILRIPMFRPSRYPDAHTYHPRGNDKSIPAVSCETMEMRAAEGYLDFALFYGGLGDGRHFYQQLHHIYAYDQQYKKKLLNRKDKIRLTLVDIHPKILARNVMMFQLLYELQQAHEKDDTEEYALLQATIWYLFASDIMPLYICDKLELVIHTLLTSKDNFDIPWLKCSLSTCSVIRAALKDWLECHEKLSELFSVSYIQKKLKWDSKERLLQWVNRFSYLHMDNEWEQFKESKITYPHPMVLKEYEPLLLKLIEEQRENPANTRREAFAKYAQKEWTVNFALLQTPDWYETRGNDWNETVDILKVVEDLLENLTSFWDQEFLQGDLASKSAPTHISELCMPFFRSCANALALSEVAVTVELVHDEVYHFLDTVRFGVAHDKTSEYYDAMFLSNTPDYTGGYLTVYLHALPLLSSCGYAESSILLHPEVFTEGFPRALAEYTGVPHQEAAESLLGLVHVKTNMDDINEAKRLSLEQPLWSILKCPSYWRLAGPQDLPQKLQFTLWLTHMFFKLALPVPRDSGSTCCVVEQPLTLSTFVRLCASMVADRGIPMHWVSNVVDSILDGTLTTRAIPPRTVPLTLDDAGYLIYPESVSLDIQSAQTFHLQPLLPELRALLVRYMPVLGFRLLTPLPPTSFVGNHVIPFEIVDVGYSTAKVLTLFFVGPDAMQPGQEMWREIIGGGKVEDVYIVSSFKYDILGDPSTYPLEVEATWQMERSTMEVMRRGNWTAHLVETDKYLSVSRTCILSASEKL